MADNLVSRIRAWLSRSLRLDGRTAAEQSLREANERYELVLAGADAAVWDWDVVGNTIVHSSRWKAMRGYAGDELGDEANDWSEAIHPDDAPRVMAAVQEHFDGRTPYFAEEYRVRRKDGSWMWVADRGLARRDAAGRVVRMAGAETDITPRKQAEELARLRLVELEDLYRNAPVGMCVLDRELRFIRVNQRLAEINGIPAVEHIGKTVREVMPELADAVEPGLLGVLETGQPCFDLEVVSETPAQPGVRRSWLEQWLPIADAEGRITQVSIVVEETTERKLAEQALTVHRQLLETVIRQMPAAVCLIRGSDLRLQLVNPAYQMIAPGKEMLGRTLDEIWPETGQDFAAICRRVLESGEPHQVIDELNMISRRPDGPLEPAYFSWSMQRVQQPGDEGPGLVIAAWETTDRKQSEEALRQSREDLDRAQEVGQIGWWRLDVRRNVLTWSDESHRIFGVPVGTPLSYQTFLETIHPDDRDFVDERWNAGLRGEPYDVEHRIVADGQIKWVREKAYLEFDPQGVLLGGFGITQDITERKRIEQQLRESLAEKELLLREIHHRVKNNLQVVSSLVSLQSDALADPALREVFGELRDRVRSMALIHEKLYESGGLAKLNFADYIASLMQSIWSAHGVVGVRVKLHLEVEPVAVSVATAVPCGLILNELASNALKHAFPSDGGEVTVGLCREPATGRLRLRVADNGVGMPADLDWRRSRSLGLRLVQMLARQLEGSIETGAGAGPGTEFLIRFVATEVEEVPGLTDAASSTTSGGRA